MLPSALSLRCSYVHIVLFFFFHENAIFFQVSPPPPLHKAVVAVLQEHIGKWQVCTQQHRTESHHMQERGRTSNSLTTR